MGFAALVLAAGLLERCSTLPSLEGRSVSTALPAGATTRLDRMVAPLVRAHPGKSGVYTLADGREALAARLLLAQAAERSLDLQYYIWRGDRSGMLLFDALRAAADRGVRVRLLLDDSNTAGLDAALATLDLHPNIEVRLFNPFPLRSSRTLGYLADFARLNRRMHNKAFIADGEAAIVGGRNVGDEYFDVTDGVAFVDLDVLAVGPVVEQASRDFDRYWASGSSYPADRLLPRASAGAIDRLARAARRVEWHPATASYLQAMRDLPFARDLAAGGLTLEWAAVRMLSDDPAKGLGRMAPQASLRAQLKAIFGDPATELDLVSPYFVPTAAALDWFAGTAGRGVKIRVLTNSLEATDVPAVHAGYARWRKPLLAAGISVYELRREPGRARAKLAAIRGSSGASLHAKVVTVDGVRVFIGSLNFDPRSALLNTETGLVIDSPALARALPAVFEGAAYEVRLSEAAELYWLERRGAQLLRHDTEPGGSPWRRAGVWLLSRLPIESLL